MSADPAKVHIERTDDDCFRVRVVDGNSATEHEVSASAAQIERYGGGATAERLIEASFEFLLEREAKESILRRFELSVIERYFPDYPRVIRDRCVD